MKAAAIILSLFISTLWAIQGDIVLTNKLNPQVQVSWNVDAGKMSDTQLYDMLARYYGAPRTPSGDELRLDIDLFSRPQGFLFFSIGGLSSSQMPQTNSLKLLTKNLIDLIPSDGTLSSSYPLLASVLSGTGPSFHGVHAHNHVVQDVYGVGNFFDAMKKLYEHKEMVSASSSLDGALVLSPHLKNFGRTTNALSWDSKTRSFSSVAGTSKYTLSVKEFATLLKNLDLDMEDVEILYNEAEGTVTINRPGLSAITFDLSSSSVEKFFAEVLFVQKMIQSPVHFFSFHFESLNGIATQYGSASDEYVLAVQMIDAVIAKMYNSYKLHHSLEMSIIYCPAAYHNKPVLAAIQPILESNIKTIIGKDVMTTISDNLPDIFLSASGKEKVSTICGELKQSLEQFDVDVKCESLKRALQQTPGPQPTPPPAPAPGPATDHVPQSEVELVHICMWFVLAMICALLQACYKLAVLDGSNEPEFKPKTYEGGLRSKTTKM